MKYKSDIEKMQVALEEAKKALEIDEVPVSYTHLTLPTILRV